MPLVGKKKFSYTPEGVKAARKYAKKVGKPIKMRESLPWQDRALTVLLEFKFKSDKPLLHKDLVGYINRFPRVPSGATTHFGKALKRVRKGKTANVRGKASETVGRLAKVIIGDNPKTEKKVRKAIFTKYERFLNRTRAERETDQA